MILKQRQKNIQRLSPLERECSYKVKHLNELLASIPDYDDCQERWRIFFEENVPQYLVGFSRQAFRKKELYKRFRDYDEDQATAEWYRLFWNNNKFVFQPTLLREYFTMNDGIEEILWMIDNIIKDLTTKEYLKQEKDTIDEDKEFHAKALALFQVDDTTKPSRQYIMTFYKKKALEVHPDKHPASEKDKWAQEFSFLAKCFKYLLERYAK